MAICGIKGLIIAIGTPVYAYRTVAVRTGEPRIDRNLLHFERKALFQVITEIVICFYCCHLANIKKKFIFVAQMMGLCGKKNLEII